MCCALYQGFVHVQKLVLLPLEGGASVRTFIVIGVKCCIFMHHEYGLSFTLYFYFEATAAGVFDLVSFAKKDSHNVC